MAARCTSPRAAFSRHGSIPYSRGLRKAHAILDSCTDARGYVSSAPGGAHERMLIRLAFLAPDIQAAILAGEQPGVMSLETIRYRPLPLCWDDQRAELGR